MEFWLSGMSLGCETVELVKMKSLIESKHQKIPFYDCNLTTPGYFLLGRMLLKTSKIRAWRRVRMREQKKALATSSSREEKQAEQRKYSNPILISDNSHSLNLFEWKESCSGEESEQRQQRNWTSFRVAAPHTVYYMLESEVASVWVGEMANKWIELNLIHRHCFQLVSHLIVLPFPLFRRRRLYGCRSILHRHRSIPPHSLLMLLLSPGPRQCLMKMYRGEIFYRSLLEKSSRVSIISYV